MLGLRAFRTLRELTTRCAAPVPIFGDAATPGQVHPPGIQRKNASPHEASSAPGKKLGGSIHRGINIRRAVRRADKAGFV
jgi:hypothetical protein